MNKLQSLELDIACEIKRICDIEGIDYFLMCGSLLGAVRHEGFIPWDDDFDFGMLRKDYQRFLEVAPKYLGSKYFLQTYDTDKHYGLCYAKVRLEGTTLKEEICKDSKQHSGVWVDIFPFDNYPDDESEFIKIEKKLKYYAHLMRIKNGIKLWEFNGFSFKYYLRYLPFIIASWFYKRDSLAAKRNLWEVKFNDIDTKRVYVTNGKHYRERIFRKESLSDLALISFEGVKFKAPKNYDEVLTELFGDYMTPPKKELQTGHAIIEQNF